tara:strand:+ start:243 stop:947 length:705 start_codon:yes stop_codon:yes gene_type:complete
MPTYSTTKSFDLAINDMIQEAYERCGIMVRDGYDLKTAKRSLNILLAEWANRGLNLWTIQQTDKTLTPNAQSVTGTNLYGTGANDASSIIDITNLVINDGTYDYAATSISRATYFNMPNKATSGRPSQFYFQREINPTLYLYPAVPASGTYTLKYYAMIRMFDIDAYTNNAQIPFRFIPALTAGLSYYLSQKKAPERMQALKLIYEDEWRRAADQDGSRTSLYLTPQAYFPSVG